MDDLKDIEAAIKSTLDNANFPKGPEWFEEHWKPKFARVRACMVPNHYLKVIEEIEELESFARSGGEPKRL
jgi:hypothetical protein